MCFPVLLRIAEEFRVDIAVHLEPYPGRNPDTVKSDIEYLISKHGASPSLHRRGGLPVFYIYDAYHNPKEAWAKVLCKDGAESLRGSAYDAFTIATLLDASEKSLITDGCFDGAYSYFATDGFTHGSTSANWKALVNWAKSNDKIFVPSAAPGYNDEKIRPWNARATRSRKEGAYFMRMLDAAYNSGSDIISITSFNEFGEGTQIERSTNYSGGPQMYLQQLLDRKVRAGYHAEL